MFNARLYAGSIFIAVADAWWREAGVVGEVDSRAWHLSPDHWEHTMQRHARMSAHGIVVLHFSPARIRTDPAGVVADIKAALAAGQAPPPSRARLARVTGLKMMGAVGAGCRLGSGGVVVAE
jgi:hypothetical protein